VIGRRASSSADPFAVDCVIRRRATRSARSLAVDRVLLCLGSSLFGLGVGSRGAATSGPVVLNVRSAVRRNACLRCGATVMLRTTVPSALSETLDTTKPGRRPATPMLF
jgi:hypothetical protein